MICSVVALHPDICSGTRIDAVIWRRPQVLVARQAAITRRDIDRLADPSPELFEPPDQAQVYALPTLPLQYGAPRKPRSISLQRNSRSLKWGPICCKRCAFAHLPNLAGTWRPSSRAIAPKTGPRPFWLRPTTDYQPSAAWPVVLAKLLQAQPLGRFLAPTQLPAPEASKLGG